MLPKRRTLSFALLALLAGNAIAQDVPRGKLVVTGSSTLLPLVGEIAKRFQSRHAGVEISVSGGGSGKGVADVRAGAAHIGMVSRPLVGPERALQAFPIARDGVSFIVHADNPVNDITLAQVKDVITGAMRNWKPLGGREAPIGLIWRGEGQGSTGLLLEHFHLAAPAVAQPYKVILPNAAVIEAVAAERDALAPVSVGEAERTKAAGARIKLLRIDGIEASSGAILNGQYPLARPLSLVTAQLPAGLPRAFVEFAMSPAMKDLVRKYDFVPYHD